MRNLINPPNFKIQYSKKFKWWMVNENNGKNLMRDHTDKKSSNT